MLKFKFESKSQLKQENNKKNNKENNKERRIKAENKYNDGKFIYSWKSETNSWIIGDTSRSNYKANAILAGSSSNCPDEIVFKGIFNLRENRGNNVGSSESNEVKEGPVEEVGRMAFNRCGYNSNTNKVVVPKEVKIIRAYGFYSMHKVTNFTIEIGSQLESIEYAGLDDIGYNLDDREDSASFSPDLKNLILPHTLKSVSVNGIAYCNRFTRIIYCGNHNLNINSSLYLSNKGDYTKVYITPEYKAKNENSNIFGRAATGVLSEDEIEISCSGMLPQPTPPPSVPPSPSQPLFNSRCSQLQFSLSPLWSLVCALLPSNLNLSSLPSPPSHSHSNSHSHSHSKSNSCLSFLTKVPHLSFS